MIVNAPDIRLPDGSYNAEDDPRVTKSENFFVKPVLMNCRNF